MTRIYISSTYTDLKDYREAASRLLSKVPGRQIHAMEGYVASDDRPLDKCLQDVAACDIYVGIFAWRYGFIPRAGNDEGLSITALEYRKATETGKPRLIFLLDPEVAWPPPRSDFQTGEGDAGKKIAALRKELGLAHTVSSFRSPDELAGLVSAAVTSWEREHVPQPADARPSPVPVLPQVRELRNSLLLAFAPGDEALTRPVAEACASWVEKPILLSKTDLFAHDEAAMSAVEEHAARSCATLVLLTRASLDQLRGHSAQVAKVLAVMRARTGVTGALLVDLPADQLPTEWGLQVAAQVPKLAADTVLTPLREWVEKQTPGWRTRLVGLPVSVFAMNKGDVEDLDQHPELVGDQLGRAVQTQFEKIRNELATAGVRWTKRYLERREAWQPFGPDGVSAEDLIVSVVNGVNRRRLPKLRNRQIRAQWYPFDAVLDQQSGQDASLLGVYQAVARAGCILVIDELSLFHPKLKDALTNSPFFNNDQVALVTVSPFDPGRAAINELLETEARRKLAGAFTRYASEYDPQCEFAVGEERRFKRWLHSSLPETVLSLREPPPDPAAIRAFKNEVDPGATRPTGEYPWAGGDS
jgi:Domain of unknown function (DUF4062)